LYVPDLIFQSRDCIIPVQNRKMGSIRAGISVGAQFDQTFT
jgi:hypothetical protein